MYPLFLLLPSAYQSDTRGSAGGINISDATHFGCFSMAFLNLLVEQLCSSHYHVPMILTIYQIAHRYTVILISRYFHYKKACGGTGVMSPPKGVRGP